MKLRWPVWGGRTSHRSRPRVAQAIQAARAAAAGQTTQAAWVGRLGNLRSVVDGGPRTLESYAVQSYGAQQRWRAGVGLPPTLLRATARAARASGRQPADVWAEALHVWLVGAELGREEAGSPTLIPPDPRRTRAWLSIDATLGELRAS